MKLILLENLLKLHLTIIGIEGVWHGTGILEEYSISTKYAIDE